MAVPRLYLTDGTPGYDPAVWKGTWDKIVTTPRIGQLLTGGLGNGFQVTSQLDENSPTLGYTIAAWRMISAPISAGALGGNLVLRIGVKNYSTPPGFSDHSLALHCYVTAGNSTTVRGTLLDNWRDSSAHEFTGTMTATVFTVPLATVVASANDRIVLEVGTVSYNTHTTAFWSDLLSGFAGSSTPDVVMSIGGNAADGRAVVDIGVPAVAERSQVVVVG